MSDKRSGEFFRVMSDTYGDRVTLYTRGDNSLRVRIEYEGEEMYMVLSKVQAGMLRDHLNDWIYGR